MKKNYSIALLLLASVITTNAQNLWGVDAAIDVANAEFQNNFGETTIASNYDAINWTALTVFQNDGAVIPGEAFWTRNTLGYSQGAYWSGTTPVNSPSNANGVAIFDSDFLDNGGIQEAFGTGISPSGHKGELISPRIDLSGSTNEPIAVKFFSFYKDSQIAELSVSFSNNDGTTWGIPVDYRSLQANQTEGFISVIMPKSSTQGISNLSQCRIKFTFDGDYFFAIIDDISIINATALLSVPQFNNTSNGISLYPNPSKEFIKISGLNTTANFTIYDMIGKQVSKGKVANNEMIAINTLNNGLYLIILDNGNSLKFVKE